MCEHSENVEENGKPRKAIFKLLCADYQDAGFINEPVDFVNVTMC